MFTDEEMRGMYTSMAERMLKAGWVHLFTFTEGKGLHVQWTESGTERAVCLKKIATTFHLMDSDEAPMRFTKVANGIRLGPGPALDIPEQLLVYWRESVDLLGIHFDDEDRLLILVHLVNGWAPDADTEIVFGP